jgi:hypothetical protein
MKLPFSVARDREFRATYVDIANRLHLAEFEMAGLMSRVLALFERSDKGKAKSRFCSYIGASFPRLDQPRLALAGGTRKQYYLMAQEHRRFVRAHGRNAAQVWNNTGGWLAVTILNGLRPLERKKAEAVIAASVAERGVGITVSTVRGLLTSHDIRPRKPGRPRHAEQDVALAMIRAELATVIRRLQLAAHRQPGSRSDTDKALLNAEPANLVDGAFRKGSRKGRNAA